MKDGRGRPPLVGEDAVSLFLRLARPARNEAERAAIARHEVLNFPDETYGRQLQNLAIPGLAAEGKPVVTYIEKPMRLADGEVVMLRKPDYAVAGLHYGPWASIRLCRRGLQCQPLGLG